MKKCIKKIFIFCCIVPILLLAAIAFAQISNSPRQTGEEILLEYITKPNKIIIRIGSNGCTDKSSFRINVKKEDVLSPKSPHYVLTIIRIIPDECKAMVEGGTLVTFDMEKDTRLTGDYTYSLTNRIFNNSQLIINESKVKNFKYYLTFEKQYVQLKDSRFKKGGDPYNYLNVELTHYSIGDLDGNGTDDAVVVLTSTPMGSGSFFELTTLVAETDDDFIRQTNSILLGDRIRINSLSIKSGKIVLDLTVHEPEDPSCCPSKRIVKQFRLVDGRLIEVKE